MQQPETRVAPSTTGAQTVTIVGPEHAADAAPTAQPHVVTENDASLQVAGVPSGMTALAADSLAAAPVAEAGARSRFQILRPHARGGLGQVSVALDQELNREVALKELQPQQADNATSRERFVFEAQITGGLEHPGIVPVYALGQDSLGRPFYAMRFVKGDSLKQAIDEFHRPDSPNRQDHGARELARRQLLGRFIDVCNAMEYAHSRGVLHRDLKPGNIMVGKYGETLVVDWGLAKSVEMPEIAADETALRPSSTLSSSVQTQLGSALGTPAYMSPEQAVGNLAELGPATDVYSLGATLYHILCGRPPFEKRELADTLSKVRLGDFPRPRALVPDVPRALEAICLKAMACEPAARYPSARALADDLEHWLADEPVVALPEKLAERAARWTRRHRAWAQAAAAALALVTAVSVTAALLINQSRNNERLARLAAKESEKRALRNAETARQNEERAVANEQAARDNAETARVNAETAGLNAERAEKNAQAANENEQRAKHAAKIAETNAQAAKDQYRQSIAAMLGLGVQLQRRLQGQPGTAADDPEVRTLSRDILKLVGASLAEMAKNLQAAGVTDFAMAATHDQMGELLLKLGHGAQALEEFESGRKLVEQSAAERPGDDVARANLALLTMKIGRAHLDVHDDARAALKSFLASRDLQREIMNNPKSGNYKPADNQRLLSVYEIQAGVAELRLGHPQPAREHFEAALALRRAWLEGSPGSIPAYSYVSECHLWLGTVAWRLGDAPGAETSFQEALRICRDLAERQPGDASFLGDLAEVHGAFGDAQMRLGKLADARESYSKSHDYLRRLLSRTAGDVSALPLLAQTLERRALLAEREGDAAQAARSYEEARGLRDRLSDLDPQNLSWLAARALTYAHCGLRAQSAEQVASLIQRAPESPSARLQAARCFAVCSQSEPDAAQKRQLLDQALASIAAALTADFADPLLLTTDPDLAPLQSDPAFQSLLEKLK